MLRTALAMSLVTGKPFRMEHIRKGRDVPGLKNQHVHAVKAVESLTSSSAEGVEPGSLSMAFSPGPFVAGRLEMDTKTAASIPLLLQALLLPCMVEDRSFSLRFIGGTDTAWSPTFAFFKEVFLAGLVRLAPVGVAVHRRGFYPKGGGVVEVSIPRHCARKPLKRGKRGKIERVYVEAFASASLQGGNVAERMVGGARGVLERVFPPDVIEEKVSYSEAKSPGAGVLVMGQDSMGNRLGSDALGERGVLAEKVGARAARSLLNELRHGSSVDVHVADMLIPFMAVFGGSVLLPRRTRHVSSNVYVCNAFLEERNHVVVSEGVAKAGGLF